MSTSASAEAGYSLWLLTDAAGVVSASGPGSGQLLGMEPRGRALAELFGEPVAWRLLSGPEDAIEWQRPASQAGGEPIAWGGVRHRLADGGLLVRAGPLRASRDEVPVAWERRMEKLLHETHQRLELAVGAGRLGLWDWLAGESFVYLSPIWKAQLGFEDHELPNSFETWAGRMHPEDAGRSQETLSRYVREPALGDRFVHEFRMRAKDGSWRWIASYGLVLRGPDGQGMRVTGCHLDITDAKRREAEQERLREDLRRTNEHLERLARMKDEFLANMSHELRTPLNAVLGQAEAMAEGIFGPVTPEQGGALQTIEESGRHLLSLINDVLDITKSTVGHLELELAAVPVEQVCQESLRLVREQARRKGISVVYTHDGDVPNVWADRRRLRQVLINLLSNAKKFTPEGGRIGLEVRAGQGGTVALTVWDSGLGIREEDQQRIFEPFVQLDSGLARRHEGSGLGLALVRRLEELHHGWLELESEVGRGSRFTVVLPVEPHGPAEARSALESRSRTPVPLPDAALIQRTVLIADDNESNTRHLEDYLRAHGFRVRIARDGEEALRLCREVKPAVVLMDIQMPRLDGLEAIRQLRADGGIAHVPVVALTALAMPGDRERCLAAGADDYLSKPVRLAEMLRLVRRLIASAGSGG